MRVSTDKAIAGFLNRNGLKTGRGNRWTQERVTSLRGYQNIPRHCPETKTREGWLTLSEASKFLGISARTLRISAEMGDIPGQHPLADGPWVFKQSDLQSPIAEQLVTRTRRHRGGKYPAVPHPAQIKLDFSGT